MRHISLVGALSIALFSACQSKQQDCKQTSDCPEGASCDTGQGVCVDACDEAGCAAGHWCDPTDERCKSGVPRIFSFIADPARIAADTSATLQWNVAGADTLTIAPGVGLVTGTSIDVSPAETTVYTLTAANAAGSVSVTAQVEVFIACELTSQCPDGTKCDPGQGVCVDACQEVGCADADHFCDTVDDRCKPVAPVVTSFVASSAGSNRNLPQAGMNVDLVAVIDPPAGHTVTACTWNGPSVQGTLSAISATEWKCSYSYGAPTGISGHGNKSASVAVTYEMNGLSSSVTQSFSYKVFFQKDGKDDGVHPNWFLYWGDTGDGAVPGFTSSIAYDSAQGGLGRYTTAGDVLTLGPNTSGNRFPTIYPNPLELYPTAGLCPGGTFPQVSGIDTVAQVIGYLDRKKVQYHNVHDNSGIWHNGFVDTDGDGLPNAYETGMLKTSASVADSCDLASALLDGSLSATGDAELDAIITGATATNVPANDWANPGKQADASPAPASP